MKGANLDLSKSVYLGAKKNIWVTCKVHGDYQVLASNLMRGSNCIQCVNNENSEKRRTKLKLYKQVIKTL